jgi:hypothetical protein
MGARSLSTLLDTDDGISRLSAHASRLLQLQRAFEKAVPAALARFGRVANLKQGRIVIHAENGAIAAKIMQVAPRLADVFLKAGAQVSEVQVKVQPLGAHAPGLPPPHQAALIGTIRDDLNCLAEQLPEASPLRSALERLTRSARIRQTDKTR